MSDIVNDEAIGAHLAGSEPTVEARRRGWWRTNRLALLSLVVVIPSTLFVVLGLPAIEAFGREPTPQRISFDEPVDAAGFRWQLTASVEFPGEGLEKNGVPTGSALVAALLSVTPLDGATSGISCETVLTDRPASGADERTWLPLRDPQEYKYGVQDDSTSYCDLDSGEPLALEVVFLTPPNVFEAATVDVILAGSERAVLRFSLE